MATQTAMHDSELLTLDELTILKLKSSVRGNVILRDDPDFEEARKVYNGMIDRHPMVIVRCRDVADVIECVRFADSHNLKIAVRGGGHNAAGLGVCDDGLVIDLSSMRGIRVNLSDNTVRVDGGCLLGDIDHVTQAFGKAVPTGIFSTTGIAGLTLGGGMGHLSRAYGLAIDNLIEADVVLADGTLVTASETTNSDLFWAIRGGGGNFGIVVSFLFRMQEAGTVYGGPMLWHFRDSETILRFYRDFITKAPNHVYGYFAFLTVPPVPLFPAELHLKQMCGIVWCILGDKQEAAREVDRFRALVTPALDLTGDIPFATMQAMFDPLYPKGMQWYWKADFVNDLSDEAIAININYAAQLPTPHSTMHLYPVNGAVHDKKEKDTAFAYRKANWAQVIVGVDPDPGKRDLLTSWAQEYWAALHPFSAGGAYVNFLMDEGADRVKASFGGNFERLSKVKAKYDPRNLFSVNQNIKPA